MRKFNSEDVLLLNPEDQQAPHKFADLCEELGLKKPNEKALAAIATATVLDLGSVDMTKDRAIEITTAAIEALTSVTGLPKTKEDLRKYVKGFLIVVDATMHYIEILKKNESRME